MHIVGGGIFVETEPISVEKIHVLHRTKVSFVYVSFVCQPQLAPTEPIFQSIEQSTDCHLGLKV